MENENQLGIVTLQVQAEHFLIISCSFSHLGGDDSPPHLSSSMKAQRAKECRCVVEQYTARPGSEFQPQHFQSACSVPKFTQPRRERRRIHSSAIYPGGLSLGHCSQSLSPVLLHSIGV